MKKVISLIIAVLLLIVMLCGCDEPIANESSLSNDAETSSQQISSETRENKKDALESEPKKEVIDISSDDYYDLIKKIFDEATEQNGYFD